jgi:hypothetical protein
MFDGPGKFQITTGPPQSGHQITGTTVDELWSLLVVSQVFQEAVTDVTSSVEAPAGYVVTHAVEVGSKENIVEDGSKENTVELPVGTSREESVISV